MAIATCASAKRPLQARVRWHDASQVAWSLLPGPISLVHHTRSRSPWRRWRATPFADNINKQARKERTDWINKQKNKQATNGFLSSAPVGGARAA